MVSTPSSPLPPFFPLFLSGVYLELRILWSGALETPYSQSLHGTSHVLPVCPLVSARLEVGAAVEVEVEFEVEVGAGAGAAVEVEVEVMPVVGFAPAPVAPLSTCPRFLPG